MRAGVQYKLDAWDESTRKCAAGIPFYNEYIKSILPHMWEHLKALYPTEARDMRRRLRSADGTDYGLEGTGWSKVTVSIDNPTCMHVSALPNRTQQPNAAHLLNRTRALHVFRWITSTLGSRHY